jgi:hypothetical protein
MTSKVWKKDTREISKHIAKSNYGLILATLSVLIIATATPRNIDPDTLEELEAQFRKHLSDS